MEQTIYTQQSYNQKVTLVSERVLIGISYIGLLLIFRLLGSGLAGIVSLGTLLLCLGIVAGLGFGLIDNLVYIYFTAPNAAISIQSKNLIHQRRFKAVIELFTHQRQQFKKLAMENVLFVVAWASIGLFLITSSPSDFGRGVVLGIGLDLMYGFYHDWPHKEYFKERLFWPIKRGFSMQELKSVVFASIGWFLLLSYFVI